jgi:hypothetical protein
MARLVNAFASAYMVIFIYNITLRNFGEKAARITAVMATLLPAFIYYSGLHMKETFMVFLLMAFMDHADDFASFKEFRIGKIIKVILLGTSLFFFRTVLATAAWFALFSSFLLSSDKLMNQYKKLF